MVTYPKDWKVQPIKDAVEICQGGTPKTTVSEYWNGSIIWITPGEITKLKSIYVDNSERKITELGLIKSSACLLPEGAILLCSRATIGDLAIAKKPMATNQGFKNLVCKTDVHNVYLAYLLTTKKADLIEKAIGTTFLEISKKELSKIQVALPSLPEQRAIAETLSCIDAHIANLTELIEKKKDIRDGALKDLISGRTRLDGFDGEWEDTSIGGMLTILHGRNQRDVESFDGKYPILGTGGVIGKANEYLCDWECVLIGRKGTIDKPTYMNTPFWTIDTLYYSRSKENQCVKYQYYLFCTIDWYSYTESSGRPSLAKKVIEGIQVKIPRYDEQKAIVAALSSLDAEIASLEEEKNKMLQIKAGALDDLLTGRVRLMSKEDNDVS